MVTPPHPQSSPICIFQFYIAIFIFLSIKKIINLFLLQCFHLKLKKHF